MRLRPASNVLSSFIISLFVISLFSCGVAPAPARSSGDASLTAYPFELDPKEPAPKRIGGLIFLGGFELKSSDPRFGGLSGLSLSPDGTRLYAVSDRGYWVSMLLSHDPRGRLIGFGGLEIGELLTPEGNPVRGLQRDAEGLARDRDGSLIVSFEHIHRLWRYPPPPASFRSPAQPIPTPPELQGAPANGGLEGVAVLPDGRLVAVTEEYENPDGSTKGWLIDQGRFHPLSYLPSDGFRLTDLAALSNGDVLVLERRYNGFGGFAAKIKRISREAIRPGARLKGKELARLAPPLAVDNFEGLAVREDPQRGIFLYIVSDDNYNTLQRTLLFQFRLEAGKD